MADTVKLVKMIRGGDRKPFSADVHPDEVANFKRGGWEIAKTPAPQPQPKSTSQGLKAKSKTPKSGGPKVK